MTYITNNQEFDDLGIKFPIIEIIPNDVNMQYSLIGGTSHKTLFGNDIILNKDDVLIMFGKNISSLIIQNNDFDKSFTRLNFFTDGSYGYCKLPENKIFQMIIITGDEGDIIKTDNGDIITQDGDRVIKFGSDKFWVFRNEKIFKKIFSLRGV